jgi:HSP20 family protein
MADTTTNEQQKQSQQSQGQDAARGSQQRKDVARQGGTSGAVTLAPIDLLTLGPFALMRRMNDEIERMFRDAGSSQQGQQRGSGWAPPIEVQERDGKLVIRAELPGIKADDVTIAVTDDAVVIEGERRIDREQDRNGIHVTEHRYGRFYREIPLPERAKTSDAVAKIDNGVLEIEVPVAEQRSNSRQIPVQGASQSGSSQQAGSQGSSQQAASQGSGNRAA